MQNINASLNKIEQLVGELPADVTKQTFNKPELMAQLKALQEAVAAAVVAVEAK